MMGDRQTQIRAHGNALGQARSPRGMLFLSRGTLVSCLWHGQTHRLKQMDGPMGGGTARRWVPHTCTSARLAESGASEHLGLS